METGAAESAQLHNFSTAYERLFNVVAIADTRNADEALQQLILQCFTVLPGECSSGATSIIKVLRDLFGLGVSVTHIQACLDRLAASGKLLQVPGSGLALAPEVRIQLQVRIDEAARLETVVKEAWLEQIAREFPPLPSDLAWHALKQYLAVAFGRHGLLTTVLLDPSVDTPPEYSSSLTSARDCSGGPRV